MPTQVRLVSLDSLSHEDSPNEIFLETNPNTQLNIESQEDATIISFPYGNKFDVVGGKIIIYEK